MILYYYYILLLIYYDFYILYMNIMIYIYILGEGTSKAMESELTKRDIEQREYYLRATNKQLQETMIALQQEYAIKEDHYRQEINELHRKWQLQIQHRENLANEMTIVTTPLLRQIAQLQEQLRQRTEIWTNLETNYCATKLTLENQVFTLENKLQRYEELQQEKQVQYTQLQQQYHQVQQQLQSIEYAYEKAMKQEKYLM